jgi:phage antirepressor YoqD-like protein
MTGDLVDLTVDSARVDRDRLADRTDVLDKVGILRTLPDDMHVTTDMVAEFYEVPLDTIKTAVKRNRDELNADGLNVVDRDEFGLRFNLNPGRISAFMLYPRRAVLRIGMLLRDSTVARRVRDHLLDVEASAPRFVIPQTMSEALRLAADEHEARELAEAKVAELEPKANLADDYLIAQGGARLVRQVAKTFGMKEHELRNFMLDQGLIFKGHSPCGEIYYDHYSQFSHYFLPRETIVRHQWGQCSHYTLTVLPRGIELLGRRIERRS